MTATELRAGEVPSSLLVPKEGERTSAWDEPENDDIQVAPLARSMAASLVSRVHSQPCRGQRSWPIPADRILFTVHMRGSRGSQLRDGTATSRLFGVPHPHLRGELGDVISAEAGHCGYDGGRPLKSLAVVGPLSSWAVPFACAGRSLADTLDHDNRHSGDPHG